jgi:hypothetical protein
MKILEKDGKYQKVSNDWIADNKVKQLGYRYASREEWKKNVRDVNKTLKESTKTEEVPVEKKKSKPKK